MLSGGVQHSMCSGDRNNMTVEILLLTGAIVGILLLVGAREGHSTQKNGKTSPNVGGYLTIFQMVWEKI